MIRQNPFVLPSVSSLIAGTGKSWAAAPVALSDASLVVEGDAARNVGNPLAVADLDADGTADLVLGSASNRGQVSVVFGPASGMRDLGMGGADLRILGPRGGYAEFGNALASGDGDGDGLDDLLVGASGSAPTAAYLFHGPVTASGDVADADATLLGLFGSGAGKVVAMGSDLDGDSLADLLIGAPNASSNDGTVYVASGAVAGYSSLEGSSTYVLEGSSSARLGFASTDIDDVDGDGIGEIAASEPTANTVYVVQGGLPRGTYDVEDAASATIQAPLGQFGNQLAKGDYDGDGAGDLFVQALYVKTGRISGSGQVYAFTDVLAASSASDADTIWTTRGEDNFGLGTGIAVGDVDGDAAADVLLGAPLLGIGGENSAAYLQLGFTPGTVDVRDLTTIPSTSPYIYLGQSVGLVPDWTGDGGAEIVVGAPHAEDSGGTRTGAAYLFPSDLFY